MTHTPGPWKLAEMPSRNPEVGHYVGVDTNYPEALNNGQRSIATMTGCGWTTPNTPEPRRTQEIETNRANARLIAAAPEMLAALQRTQQQLCDFLAAIRDQQIESRFIDDATNMMSEGDTTVASARAAIARATGVPESPETSAMLNPLAGEGGEA